MFSQFGMSWEMREIMGRRFAQVKLTLLKVGEQL